MEKIEKTLKGMPLPLGVCKTNQTYNFALFSQHAKCVTLVLFKPGADTPYAEVPFDPKINKTGNIWHLAIDNLPDDLEYGYRVDGMKKKSKLHPFNPDQIIHDPYVKMLNSSHIWEGKRNGKAPKHLLGKINDSHPFDWEGDTLLHIPMQDTIIYEMHVKGFTQHGSSQVAHPGTYLGIIEKIPHLKQLGVTAVELLPIHEFDECENPRKNPKTEQLLCNFWGYSTINFFTPMARYASSSNPGDVQREFKEMVKAFHKAGIEVILDVVFNHTGEGSHLYSFRGIDNAIYYLLDPHGHDYNFSGCGNTMNCNHHVVTELILASLRHFVIEYHIDGFRFDLASILTRDSHGAPMGVPPCVHAISQDPILANVKLIAEAWDAGGLYQVGSFPSYGRWMEWNGKYRDITRSFLKGTDGKTADFTSALSGSQILYGHDRRPYHSINFVIAHDGFTLRDLVSYQNKHNEENGENNQDGTNDNESWNCGAEGKSSDPHIVALRERQMRNMVTALMVSIGTPMIFMGDEYGHTRNGNNNAYCQNNELNFFLWNELDQNKAFLRFYTLMIHFRKNEPLLRRSNFLTDEDVLWHGIEPFKVDFGPENRILAYTLRDGDRHNVLYIAFNAHFEDINIHLPLAGNFKKWFRIVDTSLPSPDDFVENPQSLAPLKRNYKMKAYSALIAKAL